MTLVGFQHVADSVLVLTLTLLSFKRMKGTISMRDSTGVYDCSTTETILFIVIPESVWLNIYFRLNVSKECVSA